MKILTSVNFQKTAKKPEESIQCTGTAESLHISFERLHKRFPWQQDMKPLQGFCDPSSEEVYLLLRIPVKRIYTFKKTYSWFGPGHSSRAILLLWCLSILWSLKSHFFFFFLKNSERCQKIQNCHCLASQDSLKS